MSESIKRFRALEIMELVLKINGAGSAGKNGPCAFAEFYGHTGTLSVSIYEKGWVPGTKYPDIRQEAHLDNDEEMEIVLCTLLKVLHKKCS